MPKITLTYFDFAGSRGEECRLALHLAGVPFEDERLKGSAWQSRKASAPFGALPVLTVEGHSPIAQSNADIPQCSIITIYYADLRSHSWTLC